MRLENILALTNGKLINDPFVKNFQSIVFDVKHIKRGDLFIAFDEGMIEDAILNGAYGVVFDKPTQISDTEIAWVQVQDCEDALKRLLRFRLIDKDIAVYKCNEIVLKLSLQIITDSNFIVVHGDIKSIHKQLWDLNDKSTLLFSPSMCDENLFTNVKELLVSDTPSIEIIEQTLFETSFIYDNIFYERQLISPFFMPYLEELLWLYKTLKINYRLRKLTPIDHFEAVFTNKNFEIKEFGTSDKVLIFEPNSTLIGVEIAFLQKKATWARSIYLIPQAIEGISGENIFIYKNKNKIIEILKNNNFHFALIAGANKDILSKPIVNQAHLFDL
ncbi:MAG: hypothetical protein H8E76_05480 [Helicobacteraceae bacterium]|nr:hypothetical protein [Candidatus Sulfurimonas ponti]MBL6972820.1 hypothetical protein [Sulfurimonas sp.]